MADLIVPQQDFENPFDSIRQVDQDGEFWSGRDLMNLLDFRKFYPGFDEYVYKQNELKPCRSKLNAQETGLLILEFAAIVSMTPLKTAAQDASYLWRCAISVYEGSSATFIFHSVFSQINAAMQRDLSEFSFYNFIDLHWEKLIPSAIKIEKQVRLNSKNTPDYVINSNQPVEVKCRNFDGAALRQLKRYIAVMNADHGYAIAPELTVRIPDNITFIKLDKIIMEQMSPSIFLEQKIKSAAKTDRRIT